MFHFLSGISLGKLKMNFDYLKQAIRDVDDGLLNAEQLQMLKS
jgi:hypothetical protein